MSYAKDAKKDTAYTSVNHLIQPKKYDGLSIVPPYAAAMQTKSAQENQVNLTTVPTPELTTDSEAKQANVPLNAEAVTTEETATPETEAAPSLAGQQTEPPAEAAEIKDEALTLNEVEIDGGQKEDQNETKSEQYSEIMQKKSSVAAVTGAEAPTAPNQGTRLNNLAAPNQGEPLRADLRQTVGATLGLDFKNIRLHHDAQTAAVASNLGAKAFTKGDDIYFNQGEYDPDTTAGQHLITHELTHVKQQRTIPGLQYRLKEPAERDRYEQEADAVADQVVGTSMPTPMKAHTSANGPGLIKSAADVQCKDDGGSSWILRKVGELLRNFPGYDILSLVIGRDPITGQAVKRDGFPFVKAIVGLIPGGKRIFENLEKANVISKVVSWFKAEFQKLNISFQTIKSLFSRAWKSLSALDLLNPSEAFEKIKKVFMAPVQRIGNFIAAAGSKMAEFVFEGALTLVGAPVKLIMGVLNKGKSVLRKILNDPIGFLRNLTNAIKSGLGNFVGNIKTHLQNGIGGWLFGALGKAGLAMPAKFNLAGIFSIVAQILGVTWKAIRAIVVKRLGPVGEKVMGQIEKSVAFVGKLITQGPLALLEMAREFIGELPGMFFGSLIGWVRNTIIVKAVQKLISMFNPVGAIIQAVIAIYHTVQFFIERAKQIAAFVGAVFNSIAEIAGGNIGKAIAAVENALAKGLPVAISFLAALIGLGGVAAKIKDIIRKIRKPIEKVVGKVVGFLVGKAKVLIAKLTGGDRKKEAPPKNQAEHDARVKAGLAALDKEQKKRDVDHNNALTFEQAEEAAQKVKLAYSVFKSITPVEKGNRWVFEYVASQGEHKGLNVESSASYGLPRYDCKTTHGVLVTSNGERIPFSSGNANPKYSNYISASHVEGKSAIYMRENGIKKGTVYHNNTDGTCPYCDKMLQTLLEKDSVLEVIPPKGAKAPKPSWVDKPKIYVGNEKVPKQNI
ncbi:MAG: DUF4157 domain-containing protein [Bacillota bacterium]|jgi:hypothetical protein